MVSTSTGAFFASRTCRRFDFLGNLIDAHHKKTDVPLPSKDFRVGTRTRAHIRHLCENIHPEMLSNEGFILEKLTKLIELSLEKVFAEYETLSSADMWTKKAKDLINEYIQLYGQAFNLQQIAEDLGITPTHFQRIFKKETGISPKQWKQQQILQQIKLLLLKGHSISEITYRYAFSDTATCCHFFKKHVGISAQQFVDNGGDTKE